jgi:hypothetical protein
MDGGVDGGDIATFFGEWEAGTSCSDVNLDGGTDGADIETFFSVWQAGGCCAEHPDVMILQRPGREARAFLFPVDGFPVDGVSTCVRRARPRRRKPLTPLELWDPPISMIWFDLRFKSR